MRPELRQPWVVENEDIQLFTDELLKICEMVVPEPVKILEWGAGGSTLHYPSLMDSYGINYEWTAIEHESGWACEVMKYTNYKTNVMVCNVDKSLCHCPIVGKNIASVIKYTQWPQLANIPYHSFDLIYVDGRFRRRCLESAALMIKPDGLVILDNAERWWYHEILAKLFDGEFIKPHWWKGATKR